MTVPRRIAYYLWRYPILSETFIQREIAALRATGPLSLHVIADAPCPSVDAADADAPDDVHYLYPLDLRRLIRSLGRAVVRRPVALARLLGRLLRRRYQHARNPLLDVLVGGKVIYLAEQLREAGIDHLHSPWADVNAYIGLLAAEWAGIPFSLQARAHDLHRTTAAYALPEKFAAARFVVTNTRYNLDYVRAVVPEAEHGKVYQIYNGIPLRDFPPRPVSAEASDPFRLLAVGRLVEQKGFTDLLDACALLRKRGLRFHCEIVGGPELPLYAGYHRRLMARYERKELEGWVTFTGARPQAYVRAALQRADCFVLPCVLAKDGSRDIIPNVILEAMATALPVVSTPVTGIPELIEDGVDGLLVPPHDPQALADALADVIRDPALRRRLGTRARATAE
ncbi:MAG: glycosyltransferase family 4 protein, partial [Rhodothermales bacterium]|nr:glycosyltransferase family 4 protein [Rhodothermales bacterium]